MTPEPDHARAVASLAAGTLRGEEFEAWTLFEAAWPQLERFARVRLITAGIPQKLLDDCGQEVFTRVWRFRTGYRGTTENEFWRWLRQICDNERRRILERTAARASVSLGDCVAEDAGQTRLTDPDITAAKSVLDEELACLQECLRNLEAERRRVIELAYLEPALSERAIAEVLACSPSKVHKLKMEGLAILHACLVRRGIRWTSHE